jgi:hypothetical protein
MSIILIGKSGAQGRRKEIPPNRFFEIATWNAGPWTTSIQPKTAFPSFRFVQRADVEGQ